VSWVQRLAAGYFTGGSTIEPSPRLHGWQNRGPITPGKYADLVMLSDDLFKIPAEKIKDAKVVWTMVGGKEVWSK
jgi:predicted amidohydrolase YtcJ